ncbi:MAG: hypothetical protein ACI88H_000681 [Cocleimonas sp.]|jgi:hypothetical protein
MNIKLNVCEFELLMNYSHFYQIGYTNLAKKLLSKAINELDAKQQEENSLNKTTNKF